MSIYEGEDSGEEKKSMRMKKEEEQEQDGGAGAGKKRKFTKFGKIYPVHLVQHLR